MKSNTFQTLLCFLMTLLFFIGCQKEEFVNLTSTISLENYDLGAEEGKYLTFKISLTDELSEDLPLNIEIIRDIEKGRYINFDDFHDYYEYSTDSGKNWKRVRTHRVIIPERSKNIKIRMSTIDDNKLEIDEEFTMKISPKTGSIFKISGVIPPKKLIVYDNEKNNDDNVTGLHYKLNYKNEYHLAGINRSLKMNRILKNILTTDRIINW